MHKNLDKFLLLMWKNWKLQMGRKWRTAFEIIIPLLLCGLMALKRGFDVPKSYEQVIYKPFCTNPLNDAASDLNMICNPGKTLDLDETNLNQLMQASGSGLGMDFKQYSLVYSPKSDALEKVMSNFKLVFAEVVPVEDSTALNNYFQFNATNMTIAGIEFDDSYKGLTDLNKKKNFEVSIRFPGETRLQLDVDNNWKTNFIFPTMQLPGPRQYLMTTGAAPISDLLNTRYVSRKVKSPKPTTWQTTRKSEMTRLLTEATEVWSYYGEGFLIVQHLLTLSIILTKMGVSLEKNPSWLSKNPPPLISMRRYPYSKWYEDNMPSVLHNGLGTIIVTSFLFSCVNIVKSISSEKEKQLKESMKIMGLSSWLHWTAWFVKSFILLFVISGLIVVIFKVKLTSFTIYTVFTYTHVTVILFFFFFYICCTITLCFAISVFFSKANYAAICISLVWLVSITPSTLVQQKYDSLSLFAKLSACLTSNSAMGLAIHVMQMYEGTREGAQWSNMFTSNNPDDKLTLGLIVIMLIVDTFIYLFIALYVEAVFPGDYGVPQPWYFLFTPKFWRDSSRQTNMEEWSENANKGEFFEDEPRHLPVGVEIENLQKVFNKNVAVNRLSLKMYEDQITVLLGHNGAGKTTTMSMLTGMIPPTSGTAKVNGCDIRTDINGVRSSLGLCPQHNIIIDDLTVSEHIYFFSKLKGLRGDEVDIEIDKYIDLLELGDKRDTKSSKLSGGMKRKMCVAMALCGNSKVVMLDDPTAGMDPSARRSVWDFLQNQKKGHTILLTTHHMDEADLLGDRIAIMADSELQCCGSSFFLKKKYGTGYSLILDISKSCEPTQVTRLLRKYIPNIEVHSNIGSELKYLLQESQSTQFEPMLKDLEDHSKDLEVRGYGVSLTNLEDVFMKVGAGHGDLRTPDKEMLQSGSVSTNGHTRINVGGTPTYRGGPYLLTNQFLAMLTKKFLFTHRSWIVLLVHLIIPVFFITVGLVKGRSKTTGNLPPLALELARFVNPVTVVEKNPNSVYTDKYLGVLKDLSYDFEVTENITDRMLSLTADEPGKVRMRYIVGASFDEIATGGNKIPHITAWFNNDPYHSPAIALSLALNAMFRGMLDCNDCSIKFINHPMPYTAEVQTKRLRAGNSKGFELAIILNHGMAFIPAYFMIFVVTENVTKFKHLQFVSGVNVLIFWVTSALCDMLIYLLIVAVVLINVVAFQENGFKTAEDMLRLFFILFYFGWAFLPILYFVGRVFNAPSSGYTATVTLGAFTGLFLFTFAHDSSNHVLKRKFHKISLVFPHYSLISGINNCFILYSYKKMCSECISGICDESSVRFMDICKDVDDSYYKSKLPGIGTNLTASFVEGTVFFLAVLCLDFKLFSRIAYNVSQNYCRRPPRIIRGEDSDVANERRKIKNATKLELTDNYSMVLRDLTKYYERMLAVNGLCLGVQKSECFGLLGVNGAGKSTMLKMMTGDMMISYGDGWINGFNITNQINRAQKSIGYCPQFDALLNYLTVKETLSIVALIKGIHYRDCGTLADSMAREFDFVKHLNKKVKVLSGGNRRKLSTCISLIGDPPVTFLDQPTAGMDPATRRYLWNALCKIRDSGKCLILTSHSMEECEALCTRLVIMMSGNFKCLGSTQYLKNKFAEGYTITIKLRKLEDTTEEEPDTSPLEIFMQKYFPDAKLTEKHQKLLTYSVSNKSMPCSQMFGILEMAKRSNLNIEDYSLGQNSLEQVFLTFARHPN